MKQLYTIFLNLFLLFFFTSLMYAQDHINGELDAIEDLSTKVTVPIEMPDGVKLMTDIYLPITSDSLIVKTDILGPELEIELIPKGVQLIVYDTLNGQPNPNPYQLPMVFTRTPYNKRGDIAGYIINILGYGYALQDMRGRYESEGVYFPMLSDSWAKTPYHPDFDHVVDITELGDPYNSNNHEDGFNSIQGLLDLKRMYDLDGDGIAETEDAICNGSIGMFGASALGNTQYQAAAVEPIDPNEPGLKCLVPIVATNDHFTSTGYNNGVFRERIVRGWVEGQIRDLDDSRIAEDDDLQNNIHTSKDYNLNSWQEVAELCVDHFSSHRYNGGVASAYPNSGMRAEMDASLAPVNAMGIGATNGQYNRYANMEVPGFHLAGWWDIFINGQIDTYNNIMDNISEAHGNKALQKLVIGPYAHQTIGGRTTGDMVYPENATDIIGINIEDVDLDDLDVPKFVKSEAISWYRYNLNHTQGLGEPKILIPESQKWQDLGFLGKARIPASEYKITLQQLLNFIIGEEDLPPVDVELITLLGDTTRLNNFQIPEIELGDIGLNGDEPVGAFPFLEYKEVANVRFYVVGPVNDSVNVNVGNYWFHSDVFPLTEAEGIVENILYLKADGTAGFDRHTGDERNTTLTYEHDPDNPVVTVGGGNMIVNKPGPNGEVVGEHGGCCSQGQMMLSNPAYAPYTMDHPGVIQFVGPEIEDSVNMIGYPKATIYAESMPDGAGEGDPTDTDFFVRILDVYPDGREFFVVEGAVNARAREYARSLANKAEDINAPYSNIESGKIYEYHFELLPIAYTWGAGHRMKVLISSGNWNRYQSNPNLPMEDGDFFRRQPNDGQTYTYDGVEMAPRVATQTIHFSGAYPSQLHLPLYDQTLGEIVSNEPIETANFRVDVYPNPAIEQMRISVNNNEQYHYRLVNVLGQVVTVGTFQQQTVLDVQGLTEGVYVLELDNGVGVVTQKVNILSH